MSIASRESLGGKLPASITSRSGVTFDPRPSFWKYTDENHDVTIAFDTLPPMTLEMVYDLKSVLIYYVQERAPRTVKTMFVQIKYFLEQIYGWNSAPLGQISEVDLINFRNQGCQGRKHNGEKFLGQYGGFLRRWGELGTSITESAIAYMDSVSLTGPDSGERVRTRCPIHGPFTDIEQQGVISAMDNLFAEGKIPESTYWITWLVNALGLRPVQMAGLKVRDLTVERDEDGEEVYKLMVPRAKQVDTLARESFTERWLIRELGVPMFAYAEKIKTEFAGKLDDSADAPLFPATAGMTKNNEGLFQFHATALQLHYLTKTTWSKVRVISERTGERLNVHAYRFRYTFGTRMAQENCTLSQIAAGLDHTNVQSAKVYIASTPDIAMRLDLKVASTLAPVAQAFLGKVIPDESHATIPRPESRIVDMRVDKNKPVGSCGTKANCGLLKPLACYSCLSYEPWLDGPHEQLAARLIEERKKLMVVADARIASVNDRTILAVLHVAHICREELKRREALNG